MDGNGRWARARGLPRLAGHREGAVAVRRAVEAAARLGIRTLTLFAFSGDNWKRPPDEVAGLLVLFRRYLAEFASTYVSYYAGLASVMIALVFLYLTASIFVYGGELNSAICRARDAALGTDESPARS